MAKKSLQEQAEEVLKLAQERGVQSNFFFITTFKRYQVQMSILSRLESTIGTDGVLVEKEYVKGRKNLYTNPAVSEYNKTSTAANQTVSTLINIINNLAKDGNSTSLSDAIKEMMGNE